MAIEIVDLPIDSGLRMFLSDLQEGTVTVDIYHGWIDMQKPEGMVEIDDIDSTF